MNTYLRLISFARPLRHYLPIYIPFIFLAIIFQLSSFVFIVPILEVLFKRAEGQVLEQAFKPNEFVFDKANIQDWIEYYKYELTVPKDGMSYSDLLMWICLYLIITVFLSNICRFIAQRVLGSARARIVRKIRQAIYNKLVTKHIAYYTEQNRGDVVSRITNDVHQIESLVVNSFQSFIREPIFIVTIITTLFILSVKLTLISILVLPVSGFLISIVTRKLRKHSRKSQHILGNILTRVDESILGLKIIKAFNAETYVKKAFERSNKHYSRMLRKMEHKKALASPISQFFGFSIVAIVIYIGGLEVLDESENQILTGSMFMGYILTLSQLIAPVKALSSGMSSIQRGLVAGERIFFLIDEPSKIQNRENCEELDAFEKEISIEHLSFKYENHKVLDDINLKIEKGQTVALVGPSGGGKSTLIDFIPRFHDPLEGCIKIDGTDIRDLSLHSIRDKMGVVTQEAVLFNDTIFNNIAFGINATQEEVQKAAEIANAHSFIEKLENGYDTTVGDRGMKLSGGQRQRITIARAILKNPPILLLDEATSALDTESERLVQDALNRLMENRTTIVIAHRLSTIQNSDKIVVLREGKIVEEGTHQSLLEHNGLYKKLVNMQTA